MATLSVHFCLTVECDGYMMRYCQHDCAIYVWHGVLALMSHLLCIICYWTCTHGKQCSGSRWPQWIRVQMIFVHLVVGTAASHNCGRVLVRFILQCPVQRPKPDVELADYLEEMASNKSDTGFYTILALHSHQMRPSGFSTDWMLLLPTTHT